jgi:hypothetical protein
LQRLFASLLPRLATNSPEPGILLQVCCLCNLRLKYETHIGTY